MIRAVDGHDPDAVARAIRRAKREKGKPTLICCKTVIGYGAPNKQGKEECHGAALGAEEVALARKALGWPHEPFVVPDEIRAGWDARAAGKRAESRWRRRFKAYEAAHPQLAAEFRRRMDAALPDGFERWIGEGAAAAQAAAQPVATRQSSQAVLNGARPAAAGAARRLRRPHRLQQHAHQGRRAVHGRARRPATTCTTACASSAWARS